MIIYNAHDIPNYMPIYENPYLKEDQIIYMSEEGCFIASTKMYKLVKLSLLNRERKNKLNKINLI
jgi:hypothetical protein